MSVEIQELHPDASTGVRRRVRGWAAAALVAGALVYAPTVGNGFAFDDKAVIVRNRNLEAPDNLRALITETELAGAGISIRQWRPLTALTYAANRSAAGLAPWSYHATNVLLHAAVSMLVVFLGLRLGLGPAGAGAGALVFAVHPIHVEAVANVIGRKDVLATGFLLLMLLGHRWSVQRGGARMWAPLGAYVAAMLSKETGVVGLALALACDLIPEDGPLRRAGPARLRATALHVAYAAALGAFLLTYRAVTGGVTLDGLPDFADNPAAHATVPVRLMTAVAVVGKGLALQALPIGQSPDWSYDAIPLVRSAGDVRFIAAAGALLAWASLGVALRRSRPLVLLGLCWYVMALAPVANVLFATGTIFGERFLYLPSVGLALLLGSAFVRDWTAVRSRAALAAQSSGVALLALLAAGTIRYGAAWRDDLSLFTWARETAPRSTKVHHKLAEELLSAGRLTDALAEVRTALEILPTNGFAEVTHSTILGRLGRTVEREQSARRAVELLPGNADALYEVASVARDAGRLDQAAALWRLIIAANPAHGAALSDLSGWHFIRGEDELAIAHAERALRADGGAAAWYNLALVHRRRGDGPRAREALQRFVENAGTAYPEAVAAARAELARGGP